jgi:hypothetical protein
MAIENTASTSWQAAAVSADGRNMFAAGSRGNIYTNGAGSATVRNGGAIDLIYAGADTFFVADVSGTVVAP